MRRTADRPLPAGRLTAEEAAALGAGLSGAGLAYLLATVPTAAFVAAAVTVVTYILVYTPLKQVTEWNTVVGAVPGALPPVIGWVRGAGIGRGGNCIAPLRRALPLATSTLHGHRLDVSR